MSQASMQAKAIRLAKANQAIALISSTGRRFFYNATHDRVAELRLDDRGRIWWVDDYTGKSIYTHRTGFTSRWKGFSHGGTLRRLVEHFRDYVTDGAALPIGLIAPMRFSQDSNIWGYPQEAVATLKEKLIETEVFA